MTIKGGILIQQLSRDKRRATRDIDLDFLRYSIADESVRHFIETLNMGDSDFSVVIVGSIKELRHQDYNGKRVFIRLADNEGNSIETKLDIGVHKELDLEQSLLCFDLNKLDQGVTLFANNPEQIIAEKMKSLLRIGAASTRFRDVFDTYSFIHSKEVNRDLLQKNFDVLIFADASMREGSFEDAHDRLHNVFRNPQYLSDLKNSKDNWLGVPIDEVVQEVLDYFKEA